jgi:hypothetical protein
MMKPFFLAFLLACFGLGAGRSCFGNEVGAETPGVETLYLHCFSPTTGQRIVYDDSPPYHGDPPTPPKALVSLKVVVGTSFEVMTGEYSGVSGRIDRKDGALVAAFETSFGSRHRFAGTVEPEKIFEPEVMAFSGAVWGIRCVVSTSKEIGPFLKAQAELDAKRLAEATERSKRNIELHRAAQKKAQEEVEPE